MPFHKCHQSVQSKTFSIFKTHYIWSNHFLWKNYNAEKFNRFYLVMESSVIHKCQQCEHFNINQIIWIEINMSNVLGTDSIKVKLLPFTYRNRWSTERRQGKHRYDIIDRRNSFYLNVFRMLRQIRFVE